MCPSPPKIVIEKLLKWWCLGRLNCQFSFCFHLWLAVALSCKKLIWPTVKSEELSPAYFFFAVFSSPFGAIDKSIVCFSQSTMANFLLRLLIKWSVNGATRDSLRYGNYRPNATRPLAKREKLSVTAVARFCSCQLAKLNFCYTEFFLNFSFSLLIL